MAHHARQLGRDARRRPPGHAHGLRLVRYVDCVYRVRGAGQRAGSERRARAAPGALGGAHCPAGRAGRPRRHQRVRALHQRLRARGGVLRGTRGGPDDRGPECELRGPLGASRAAGPAGAGPRLPPARVDQCRGGVVVERGGVGRGGSGPWPVGVCHGGGGQRGDRHGGAAPVAPAPDRLAPGSPGDRGRDRARLARRHRASLLVYLRPRGLDACGPLAREGGPGRVRQSLGHRRRPGGPHQYPRRAGHARRLCGRPIGCGDPPPVPPRAVRRPRPRDVSDVPGPRPRGGRLRPRGVGRGLAGGHHPAPVCWGSWAASGRSSTCCPRCSSPRGTRS